jgi:hypothetical protein
LEIEIILITDNGHEAEIANLDIEGETNGFGYNEEWRMERI